MGHFCMNFTIPTRRNEETSRKPGKIGQLSDPGLNPFLKVHESTSGGAENLLTSCPDGPTRVHDKEDGVVGKKPK